MNYSEYYLWGSLKETRIRKIHKRTHAHNTRAHMHAQTPTHRMNLNKITGIAIRAASRQEGYFSITCIIRCQYAGHFQILLSLSLSHTHTRTRTRALTCTHTHTHTHARTRTATLEIQIADVGYVWGSSFGWASCRRQPSAYFFAVTLSFNLGTKCEDPRIYIVA
jgi:hypothetical protein